MPLAFPSHQGLIAPLWRRWPRRFTVLGCCVGAAIPDVVDGLFGLARGHLGQGLGHSLVGLFLLCLPLGLALTEAIRRAGRALGRRARAAWMSRLAENIERWGCSPSRAAEIGSVLAGAFSHLFFDFISHGNFLWFYPWYQDPTFFPRFWYARWAEVRLPIYEEPYPIGPHFLVWTALSIAGALMLFAPWRRTRAS